MNNKTLLIIPTYNEKGSVQELVTNIFSVVPEIDILFIDDNSNDGTKEILYSLKSNHKNINLLERPKKMGLASAYITGFKYALDKEYSYIMQMDADLSHSPSYIPTFLSAADKADFIIGSRYIKDGGVSNWGKIRKLISASGNIYAKTILQTGIQDFTGGFNLWKREVLSSLDLDSIKANGYSFLIEIKYRSLQKGFEPFEVPIVFVERSSGKSKMQFGIIYEAIWRVWQFLFTIKKSKNSEK